MPGLNSATSGPSVTLVTCLLDLPRWDLERHALARRHRLMEGVGGYLSLGRDLLRQPVPLVIFTEPHLTDRLAAIRPPDAMTLYHTLELTDLPLFARIYRRLCDLFENRYYSQVNPVKDTPSYLLTVNSKWSLLRRVAEADPFGTFNIGWIDFGLRHVVGRDIELLPTLTAAEARHPPRLCFAMPHLNAHIPPRDEIMKRFWGRIAGGLFTMPTAHVASWERLCASYLVKAIGDGYYPFEGELLLRLLLRTGKLIGEPDEDVTSSELALVPDVQPYQADYSQVISRHPAVTGCSDSPPTGLPRRGLL